MAGADQARDPAEAAQPDRFHLSRAERRQLELLEALEHQAEVATALIVRVDHLREALDPPPVLRAGSVILDVNGLAELSFRHPVKSLAVLAPAAQVTVAPGSPMSFTPTQGPGVFVVAGGHSVTVPIGAAALTFYGTPGQTVNYVAMGGFVPPRFT